MTPEVVLLCAPTVELVTLNVTVQLPLAGMAIPVKLSDFAPAVRELGVVPVQVPPTAPPTALIFVSVSVNAPPVRAVASALVIVSVTVEVPPETIDVGLNALAIVGAPTVSVAVLLALPAAGVCVVVTPEVVLLCSPTIELVMLNVTVQLPLAGMAIPLKPSAVDPAGSDVGVVPVQVPPTAPPAALMFARVSVNAPPVIAAVLLLVRVSVTVEVPPEAIEVGLNALAIVGAPTVSVAVLLPGPAVAV